MSAKLTSLHSAIRDTRFLLLVTVIEIKGSCDMGLWWLKRDVVREPSPVSVKKKSTDRNIASWIAKIIGTKSKSAIVSRTVAGVEADVIAANMNANVK